MKRDDDGLRMLRGGDYRDNVDDDHGGGVDAPGADDGD